MNVNEFLKRAADKTGFRRERYVENDIPTVYDNICLMTFYGDMRGEFLLSSFLLPRIRELHPSKYLIVCSYPGRGGLYPCADEYWSIRDEPAIKDLYENAVGFGNSDRERLLFQEQQLNKYFENILQIGDYKKYYDNGFTKEFFDKFGKIIYHLPSVPSAKVEFNRALAQKPGYKIFVYPSRMMRAWDKGREVLVRSDVKFWYNLIDKLLNRGFMPVVYQDQGSHDVSIKFESKCIYCTEEKVLDVLGVMRSTGCVLDVFSGISRFAAMARVPWVTCAERKLYNAVKDWETDGLCSGNIPYQYIFSFPTIIEGGHWEDLNVSIVSKLESFIPNLNRDTWPSTAEQAVFVPYLVVKRRKQKKIGTRFIKVPKF